MRNPKAKFISYFLILPLTILIVNPVFPYSQNSKVRIVKEHAALRLKPNEKSLLIKNLPLGSTFEAEEIIGEWVKIRLVPDNEGIVITGYVHVANLSFESKLPQKEIEKRAELPIKNNEYSLWENKLAHEKAKKSTGLVLGLVGVAILIPSAILTFTDKQEELGITYSSITYEKKIKTGYIIGDVVGFIAIVAGMSIHFSAGQKIIQLEQEGKRAGYISVGLLPKYRAIGVQIKFSF